MAARVIDGPEGVYLTAREAARHLGVSPRTLARYAEEMDWLRPVLIRGKPKWHWMDVVCLGHVLQRLREKSEES